MVLRFTDDEGVTYILKYPDEDAREMARVKNAREYYTVTRKRLLRLSDKAVLLILDTVVDRDEAFDLLHEENLKCS